jgi:predicted Zn-dependent protease
MRFPWCVAILALGVAQGQSYDPGKGVNFYSRDKEVALGQMLAKQVRRGSKLLDSAAVNAYVNRVGSNLAAKFPGGWSFTFETVRDSQGGATHEPTALPGGPIFISADLIVTAQNEAEFAGMLAHAMAHVVARHDTRRLTKENLTTISTASLSVSAPGTTMQMGALAFRRAQESEADYLAVKAMAAAGYDPAGLASYLERVQPAPAKGDVMAIVPPRDQRVKAIRTEIQKEPAGDYHASGEFAQVQADVQAIR